MSKHSSAPDASCRVLHFVRHGQYHSGENGSGQLTRVGREQARRLSVFFGHHTITRIRSSDLPRAVETSNILADALGLICNGRHRLLREVLPTRVPGFVISVAKRREGTERVERVIGRFFRTARETEHEIVVCHGNLIRALLLRITVGHLTGWHRFPIHHGSVTSFRVSRGDVSVLDFDSQVHLPLRLRTQD